MTLTLKKQHWSLLILMAFICFNFSHGQESRRGKNVIVPAAGSAFINGDYANPRYENFGQLGFKRFINSHVNLNLNYRKFNLDSQRLFDFGFQSFDLSIEYYVFPDSPFSPYVFLGSGLILSNDFQSPNNKFQAGFGLEYLVTKQIGLTLMTNGNYHFINAIDQTVYPDVDEFYLSAGIGLNFYFNSIFKSKEKGNLKKSKTSAAADTVISTNPINENR
ncbi:MAG: Curli production assembly/transport component CsgG [Bacteroidia bacterium]|nr:Curli production assembly/transport component CsgG [Bacteroidia bacterium]MBT8277599.1 Curli production assembly/transport component CsgG [Bacteroidia bacterium]NNK60514.1 Curli production assembly/transport component CsgG [Flavobacteriaceae bacterium]NNL33997.1 Curli production assembly/transport component CsgG [Flavobacteriaceae bacterium]